MTRQLPLVSVIIPIYNVEQYIESCLLSVLNQTYSNIEIICINDATQDNSMDIVYKYAEKNPNIVVAEHEFNKKQGAARNTGFAMSSGEFVIFIDSDDLLTLDAIELLYSELDKINGDVVYGRQFWNYNSILSPVQYIDDKINDMLSYNNINTIQKNSAVWYIGSPVNRLFRSSFLKKHGIFFPENIYWEDVLFTLKTCVYAVTVGIIPDIVYLRTERTDPKNLSTTQDFTNTKKYTDRDVLMNKTIEFFNMSIRTGIVDKQTAKIIVRRLLASTEGLINLAAPNLKEWVLHWHKEHETKFNEYLSG